VIELVGEFGQGYGSVYGPFLRAKIVVAPRSHLEGAPVDLVAVVACNWAPKCSRRSGCVTPLLRAYMYYSWPICRAWFRWREGPRTAGAIYKGRVARGGRSGGAASWRLVSWWQIGLVVWPRLRI